MRSSQRSRGCERAPKPSHLKPPTLHDFAERAPTTRARKNFDRAANQLRSHFYAATDSSRATPTHSATRGATMATGFQQDNDRIVLAGPRSWYLNDARQWHQQSSPIIDACGGKLKAQHHKQSGRSFSHHSVPTAAPGAHTDTNSSSGDTCALGAAPASSAPALTSPPASAQICVAIVPSTRSAHTRTDAHLTTATPRLRHHRITPRQRHSTHCRTCSMPSETTQGGAQTPQATSSAPA